MFSILRYKFKSVAGVELTISKEGDRVIRYCILDRDKNNVIKISKKGENIPSIKELSQIISKDIPIFVFVNGKGVLNKIYSYTENQKEPILREIFPGAKLDKLHSQINILEDKCLVSIIGKDLMNQIAEEMESCNLSAVEYTISPFIFSVLLPFFNIEVSRASFGKFVFEINNQEIVDISPNNNVVLKSQKDFCIGEEVIEERFITAYTAGLNLFIYEDQRELAEAIELFSDKGEWKQKQIFQRSLKLVLSSIFFILTLNSIFFFYFTDTKEELDNQFLQKSTRLAYLNSLKGELTDKKKFLKDIGWLSNTQTAVFVDRMAALVPNDLILTTINFHPLNVQLSEQVKDQVFDNKLVLVEGKCTTPLILNEYLNELKALDWVKGIRQQEYKYNDKEGIGYFKFQIEIE